MTILLQKKVLRWKITYLGKINLTMGITHTEETSLFIFFTTNTIFINELSLALSWKKKQKKKGKKRKNNINGLFFPMCFFCLFTIWCKYDWLKYRLISADSSLSDKPFLSFTYLFDLFVHLADDLDKHASSSFFLNIITTPWINYIFLIFKSCSMG